METNENGGGEGSGTSGGEDDLYYSAQGHVNTTFDNSEETADDETETEEKGGGGRRASGSFASSSHLGINERFGGGFLPRNSILHTQNQPHAKLRKLSFGVGVDSHEVPVRRFSRIYPNLNLERRISLAAPPVQKKPAVVVVRDGKKSYGLNDVPVINGFNMTVEEGSIYALLGSSGCGKTTMLSCIVGLRTLDNGVIYVFGNRPGTRGSNVPGKNLGYMPQDLSLYDNFTITETLNYYGSLYCLPWCTVKENRKWLVEFLAMPDPNRRVGSLSGGQKRRVSMAIAMIHNPSLLILDEPTVGVDPLLRESIWEHLLERATKHNTTIIITTHYIEEAKKSNTIGLMRNGKLIAEQPPKELMEAHEATLLEEVVLKLCKKDTDESQSPENMSTVRRKAYELQADFLFPNSDVLQKRPIMATMEKGELGGPVMDSIKRIYALAKKNAMFLFRNQLLLLFLICLPGMILIMVKTVIGETPKGVDFGLVNHELTSHNVNSCKALQTLPTNSSCDPLGFSCQFLKHLPKDVLDLHQYSSDEDAFYAVQRGKVWGYMSFPPDFSSSYLSKAIFPPEEPSLLEKVNKGATIKIEMDQTSQQINVIVKSSINKAFQIFTNELLLNCGQSDVLTRSSVRISEPIFGTEESDMVEYMSPGLAAAFCFFYPLIFTAMQYIAEKKLGALERVLVAGVHTWEVMAGFSLTLSFVLLVQVLVLLTILTTVSDLTIHGSYVLCLILGMLVGLSGVLMGFLLGSVCKDEVEATLVCLSLFFPFSIISGAMWPIEGMSKAFWYFSFFLPTQVPGEAMRSIVSRGWDFDHSHVWPGFIVSMGFSTAFWLMTIFVHRNKWTR